MGPRRLERLFLRWRERRDVRALARVFDATSRELLELAAHLSHDPAEAEDLVQATFLAAIENAERFDVERELIAWLVGILVREARMAKRRAARRPEPERLHERVEPDPADVAEQLELSSELQRALECLPSPYREVVVPYLREGASPGDIARALGRSPGTVRVQIHRGLERVRRTLPAGALVAAGLMSLPTRGLGAVRSAVLGRATLLATPQLVAGAAAVVPLTLGGLAVKKLALIVVSVALGTLAWRLLAEATRLDEAHPAKEEAAVAAAVHPIAPTPEPQAAHPPEPASRRALAGPAARESDTAGTATLNVHLTWASDGSPAAGVGARIGDTQGGGFDGPAEIADAQGVVVFQHVLPGAHAVRLDRAQVERHLELAPGETAELPIEVPDGLTVEGRVLDAEGHGIGAAEVLLTDPWTLGGALPVGLSASDGSFRIRGAADVSCVGARLSGWVPALQPMLDPRVVGSGPRVHVDVVLEQRSGTLEGWVRDADGHALSGADVTAGVELWTALPGARAVGITLATRSDGVTCRPPQPAHTTTDPQGRFLLPDVETGDVEVRVRAATPTPAEDEPASAPVAILPEWREHVAVRAGETTRVDVRMPRGACVEGEVRFADGSPSAGIVVRAVDREGALGSTARCDDQGRFHIAGLNPGTLALTANERGADGHSPVEARLDVADGETGRWDVELPRAASLSGTALDEEGWPLVDWRVRAVQPDKRGFVWWQQTDEDGRFAFEAAAGETYDLRLLPPGAQRDDPPHAWAQGVRPEDGEVTLQVTRETRPSASVRGVLLGPDGAPARGGLVSVGGTEFPRAAATAATSEVDGSFEFGPLPPGLYAWSFRSAESSSGGQWMDLEAEEVLDVGVLQLHAPGDVIVKILAPEGPPPATMKVEVSGSGFSRKLDHLPSGTWIARKVPAGALTVVVDAEGWPQARKAVELDDGGSIETTVELQRGASCPLVVVLPTGTKEETYVSITVRDEAGAVRQQVGAPTDGVEPIRELCLPPGAWRVEVRESSQGWTGSAAVGVESTDGPLATRTIRLEPPR